MSTKHTPGPWDIQVPPVASGDTRWIAEGKNGDVIARIPWAREQGERHANAHLIVAAPDLLAALEDLRKELRAHVKLDVKKHFSLMAADAAAGTAIHKAKGEL